VCCGGERRAEGYNGVLLEGGVRNDTTVFSRREACGGKY